MGVTIGRGRFGLRKTLPLTPGANLGGYEIVSPLGAGGMGEVYRAKDRELDRDVAIKVLSERLSQDSEAIQRFKREAKTLAALSHPHILTVFAFGSEGHVDYAVSELLEGETLGERLRRERRLPWSQALDIALSVAAGLAAAHAKGIVHRDIKPTNLFITSKGVVKILDFGLAKSLSVLPIGSQNESALTVVREGGATEAGIIMGTLAYMSPEQAKGAAATPTSDCFSFGCVLYEMLSGTAPFTRGTHTETLAALLRDAPAPFEPEIPGIPSELQRVVQKALAKETSDRFASAGELQRGARGLSPEPCRRGRRFAVARSAKTSLCDPRRRRHRVDRALHRQRDARRDPARVGAPGSAPAGDPVDRRKGIRKGLRSRS